LIDNEHNVEIKSEAECDAELKSEDFKFDELVNSTVE